jgi:hypothetical protein
LRMALCKDEPTTIKACQIISNLWLYMFL